MSLPESELDAAALVDIVTSARRIARFITGLDREAFMADDRTQDAVVRRLDVIGEAANRLSDACQASNADVPWSGLVGLRNVLAHQYDRVDYDIVWQVVTVTIPVVLACLESRLPAR